MTLMLYDDDSYLTLTLTGKDHFDLKRNHDLLRAVMDSMFENTEWLDIGDLITEFHISTVVPFLDYCRDNSSVGDVKNGLIYHESRGKEKTTLEITRDIYNRKEIDEGG